MSELEWLEMDSVTIFRPDLNGRILYYSEFERVLATLSMNRIKQEHKHTKVATLPPSTPLFPNLSAIQVASFFHACILSPLFLSPHPF